MLLWLNAKLLVQVFFFQTLYFNVLLAFPSLPLIIGETALLKKTTKKCFKVTQTRLFVYWLCLFTSTVFKNILFCANTDVFNFHIQRYFFFTIAARTIRIVPLLQLVYITMDWFVLAALMVKVHQLYTTASLGHLVWYL